MDDLLIINPLSFLLKINKNIFYNEAYVHQENDKISIRGLAFFISNILTTRFYQGTERGNSGTWLGI